MYWDEDKYARRQRCTLACQTTKYRHLSRCTMRSGNHGHHSSGSTWKTKFRQKQGGVMGCTLQRMMTVVSEIMSLAEDADASRPLTYRTGFLPTSSTYL